MRSTRESEGFAPTQPLAEYRERLRVQRRWARPKYQPNQVTLSARFIYAWVSLTWIGWALIGLLSGHMFFLISKAGPIHFSGLPAIVFSLAVIASSAAVAITIVDHYDRRDNEEAYKRTRRRLWWAAACFFCVALVIGLAERIGLLPFTDGSLGMLSTRKLQSLLASTWLTNKLAPYREAISFWSMIVFVWCIGGLFALSQLGLLKKDETARPGVLLIVICVFIGPAVAAFALNLIDWLASGAIPTRHPRSEDYLRAQLAWVHSMLLADICLLVLLALVVILICLQAIGIIPKVQTRPTIQDLPTCQHAPK